MSIDKSAEWWVGSDPMDIKEFLEAYSADQYGIQAFRLAKCTCGGGRFSIEADDDEGYAIRTCLECGRQHFICDSEEYKEVAKPERYRCVKCSSVEANAGVGFSLYEDDAEIRWLYLGVRCARCGVLGCFAGWKIAYSPSRHLLDKV